MIVAWIVITLLIALVLGTICAGTMRNEFGSGFAFVWGFWVTCCLSFIIAAIYVAAHFIGKYW